MTVLKFEVYYERQPGEVYEDDDIKYTVKNLPETLEYYLEDAKVSVTHEDYDNHRIQIMIETAKPEEEVVPEVERALSESKSILFGKQLKSNQT